MEETVHCTPGCNLSAHRLACELTFAHANLTEVLRLHHRPLHQSITVQCQVGVDELFPYLSFNRDTEFAGPPKTTTFHSNSTKIKLAYIILAHQNYAQTIRLLKAIYSPANWYVFHVDAKVPGLKEQLVEYSAEFHNVYQTVHMSGRF